MSGLFEVATWLIYALGAVMLLTVIVAAVLAGLALGFVAAFLREFGEGREEDDAQEGRED